MILGQLRPPPPTKKATTMETIPGRGATVGALAVASLYGGLPVSLIESDAPGEAEAATDSVQLQPRNQ